jgi:SsrA-binding protein
MADRKIITGNRKALHEYHILDRIEAGICLTGTEVKSLRQGNANLKDSFALIDHGEIYLQKLHISPYDKGTYFNHDPYRIRKLLLQKRQIKKLQWNIDEKGVTLIPLSLYWKGKLVKVELALARGKKQYDKRDAIAKRENDRELDRVVKDNLKYYKK